MTLASPYSKHLRKCKQQLVERNKTMTNTREEVAVGEVFWRIDHTHDCHMSFETFLESLSNEGEWKDYYPDKAMRKRHMASKRKYLKLAKAAIAASNSKYVAGLVEALKYIKHHYKVILHNSRAAEIKGESGEESIEKHLSKGFVQMQIDRIDLALLQLPEELRG